MRLPHVQPARVSRHGRGRDRRGRRTSKGGVYFHFPTKEAIFRELVRTTADRLPQGGGAVAEQTEPIARVDAPSGPSS